jgi:NTP pyrophosphatase (non-canonical NTP hydrolase)
MSNYTRKTKQELGLDTTPSLLEKFTSSSWSVWRPKFHGDPMPSLLGLSSEAGEVSDVWFKAARNDVPVDTKDIISEVGDVLFYCSIIAKENGFTIEDAIKSNMDKLQGRVNAGSLHDKTKRGSE